MRLEFVCSANMCRSPMAEHLCRRLLDERGIEGIEVASSGVFAIDGGQPVEGAVRAAARVGLDISAHRSRRFDRTGIDVGDLVIVMEDRHRRQIAAESDLAAEQLRLLGEFVEGEGDEVDDPTGGPEVAYDRCVERMALSIDNLVSRLEDEKIARA